MSLPPLHLTRNDHNKLRLLLTAIPQSRTRPTLERLRGELDRAAILDSSAVPPDLVTLGALVQYEDLGTGEVEAFTIVLPEQADTSAGRLSVITPVGTGLIGFRVGDTVDWPTPGGMRRLKIRHVTQAQSLHPVPNSQP